MTGLQDFYEAVSFTDPFQKQPQDVLCKKDVLKNLRNFRGKHLCFPVKFCKYLRTSANDCFCPFWDLQNLIMTSSSDFRVDIVLF